jgi:poly(3-hydroxybutyrate) depolymerase
MNRRLGASARRAWIGRLGVATVGLSLGSASHADEPNRGAPAAIGSKPWCAPEVSELSDHVCFFDGGVPADGRRTLVVYLHGLLATTPGFQWLQQRAMAIHAKRLGFAVLLPTSPKVQDAYVWPTSHTAQEQQEAQIVAGIQQARTDLEQRLGHGFDEAFVVGFSSGAYYASSLAVRGVLDVDGYVVLAGGFAAALAGMGWPFRAEERNAGHMVDWAFLTHGIQWLRGRLPVR